MSAGRRDPSLPSKIVEKKTLKLTDAFAVGGKGEKEQMNTYLLVRHCVNGTLR